MGIIKIYATSFLKSTAIESHLVTEFNILDINHKKEDSWNSLYAFTKEGMKRSALDDFYGNSKATSRYLIGALLLGEPILNSLKREIKKIHKDVKIDNDGLADIISNDVVKRDIVESDEFEESVKITKKAQRKQAKSKSKLTGKRESQNRTEESETTATTTIEADERAAG